MMTILAFLFVLGVLVFVHELGHFVMARLHGVRVLTFSLGFGPKLLKFTAGGTEYCICAFPLGGYVKMAGETVEDTLTGQPDEFLSQTKWVRFQVYLAGPMMNVILAFVVLALVLSRGADVPVYASSPAVIGEVTVGSPAEAAGLKAGDQIVSVDGADVPTWDDLSEAVLPKARRALAVVAVRNGQRLDVTVTPNAFGRFELGDLGVKPVERPEVMQVSPHMPAERAGFLPGDVIVAVNGQRGLPQDRIIDQIRKSAGTSVAFTVERAGADVSLTAVPQGSMGSALIGVSISPVELHRIDPTFLQAMKLSAQENWTNAVQIEKTLRGLFTRQTQMRQLMGPVAIAELSGDAAAIGWSALFNLMAMISLNLGLLNLMPVPVLDGGHIAILAVEGIARRDLSVRVKERILFAGVALMALLMVTVLYNDVARLLR